MSVAQPAYPWPTNAVTFQPVVDPNVPWPMPPGSGYQPSPLASTNAGLSGLYAWTPTFRYVPEISDVSEAEEPRSEDDEDEFVMIDEKEAPSAPLARHRKAQIPKGYSRVVRGINRLFNTHRPSSGSPAIRLPDGFVPHSRTAHGTPHPFPPGLPPPNLLHSWPTVSPFPTPLAGQGPPGATTQDWQGYGQWARPDINGVVVRNSSIRSSRSSSSSRISSPSPTTVFASLRGPNGSPHPENWVPRMDHPSLPPRPPIWSTPDLSRPPPSAWACQLNPFLQHHHHGRAPVLFDVRRVPSLITFADAPGVVPLAPGDRAQPATFPLVPELRIAQLADDPLGLPWPVVVRNPGGVTCEDVWAALYAALQERLGWVEYEALPEGRKEQVKWTYAERTRTDLSAEAPAPGWEDGCRRIDLVGTRCMLRGLEPSTSGDGTAWTMFLGPP